MERRCGILEAKYVYLFNFLACLLVYDKYLGARIGRIRLKESLCRLKEWDIGYGIKPYSLKKSFMCPATNTKFLQQNSVSLSSLSADRKHMFSSGSHESKTFLCVLPETAALLCFYTPLTQPIIGSSPWDCLMGVRMQSLTAWPWLHPFRTRPKRNTQTFSQNLPWVHLKSIEDLHKFFSSSFSPLLHFDNVFLLKIK